MDWKWVGIYIKIVNNSKIENIFFVKYNMLFVNGR